MVRVSTFVESFEEVVRESLKDETVEVTRVPINQPVTVLPEIRSENGLTIVPVLEEILVIEKQLVLKEEVHIRRNTSQQPFEVPVTIRKQRAVVERFDSADQPIPEENTS